MQKFWVEYGNEALEEVEQLIEDNASQDAKVIFSGHTGSGKSTLLAKFGHRVSDRYFVVFFSIAQTIEMSAVDHIKELRLEFEVALGKADYLILQTTHEMFTPEDPKEETFLDLLHGLQVLEYQNGEMWYDLHPIVRDLMRRKGLIDANG